MFKMTQYPAIQQAQTTQSSLLLPYILDFNSNAFFYQSVRNLAHIEGSKLPALDKRAPQRLDQQYAILLYQLMWLHNNRIALAGFELNPYWVQALELIGFHGYADPQYVLQNALEIHENLKLRLVKDRSGAKHENFYKPIEASVKDQKEVFRRCLKKYRQMNCLFLDLPCIFTTPLYLDNETKLPKIARKWLERLHQSEILAEKLYDVQWRIVKSLNGIYSVHALIYIIGDEAKYSDFVVGEWKGVCLANGYTNEVQHQPLEVHCYFAHNDMRSFWFKQLELLDEPLKIYRFESKAISYRWQTYTGNIPLN